VAVTGVALSAGGTRKLLKDSVMNDLGVIIGRFQTPYLHAGHRDLIKTVCEQHTRVLILVGVTPSTGTKRNPLEYSLRERMLMDHLIALKTQASIIILPLMDHPSDEEWVKQVDRLISTVNLNGGGTIYTDPLGCGEIYQKNGGKNPVEFVNTTTNVRSTKLREKIIPWDGEAFRSGVIYATQRRFVNPLITVDVGVWRGNEILLGQKAVDGNKWRLPGGFVNTHECFEAAARREVAEELGGIELTNLSYVGSYAVDDWRYRGDVEGITTVLFRSNILFGQVKAGDDLERASWFHYMEAERIIHPVHKHLLTALLRMEDFA